MATARPNILYCFTDQQSAQALGHRLAGLKTPAMDSIAAGGAQFTNAYCTFPLCTPSRASMFTGRMPHELGIGGNVHDIPEQLRQEEMGWIFRNAGYRTAYAGKWHLPKPRMEDGHGFEVLCGTDDPLTTQRCVEFLQRPQTEPFLLVASFFQPHGCCPFHRYPDPRRCKKLGLGHYAPSSIDMQAEGFDWPADAGEDSFLQRCPELPVNFAPVDHEPSRINDHRMEEKSGGKRPDFYQPEEVWNAARNWDEQAFRHYRWGYHRLVEWVDQQFAQILAALEASGQADNTIVVFSSDHGDMLGSHRLIGKNVLYQEAVNIPLLMRWPKVIPAGVTLSSELVSNGLDLLPTLCDAAQIVPPQGLQGRSLLPLACGKNANAWRDELVIQCGGRMGSGRLLRTGQHAYMRYHEGENREELYDMIADPHQCANLAHDPTRAELLATCRKRLEQWQAAHADAPLVKQAVHRG